MTKSLALEFTSLITCFSIPSMSLWAKKGQNHGFGSIFKVWLALVYFFGLIQMKCFKQPLNFQAQVHDLFYQTCHCISKKGQNYGYGYIFGLTLVWFVFV